MMSQIIKVLPPEIYDMDEALKIDEERSSREFNKFQEKFEPSIQRQSRYDYEDLIEQGVDPMEGIFQDYIPYPGGGFMGRNRYVKPEPELPKLETDLNLQDVMDAHDALGLDLDTNRFIKRANKAGVQVAARGGIMNL
jgi:hypothetical protein